MGKFAKINPYAILSKLQIKAFVLLELVFFMGDGVGGGGECTTPLDLLRVITPSRLGFKFFWMS